MDMLKFPSKLAITWFLLLLTITDYSLSARTLHDLPPIHHHTHHPITFYMPNVLMEANPSSKPVTTKVNSFLPFPKPLGLFPPNGGIPLPNSASGLSTQTLDLPGIGISFPARATLHDLEFGTVTVVDEDLFESSVLGSMLVGKAQGMYIASSEDKSSHMMAMTVTFVNSEFKDGMRFFGVQRTDVSESHIAVIGGTGKYRGANGYATVKAVNASARSVGKERVAAKKFLLFNVYLG